MMTILLKFALVTCLTQATVQNAAPPPTSPSTSEENASSQNPPVPDFDLAAFGTAEDQAQRVEQTNPSGGLVSPLTPEFTPPLLDSFAAFLSVTEKTPTATIAVQPLRIIPLDFRPLWGLQTSASSDTSTKNVTLDATYQVNLRWIFNYLYRDLTKQTFNQMVEEEKQKKPEKRRSAAVFDHDLLRAMELSPLNVIRGSIGVQQGYFNVNELDANQQASASRIITGSVALRFGLYADAMASYGSGFRRAKATANKASVDTLTLTALTNQPFLLGRSYYDDDYLKSGYQGGIALGGTYTRTRCMEKDEARLACPDAILRDETLAAVIEFRLPQKVTPRLQLGRRSLEKVQSEGQPATVSGIDAQLLIAFSITP